MKTQAFLLRSAALIGGIAACASVLAQGGAPSGYDQMKYRCEVLGDSAYCPTGRKTGDASVPGPYAQYLINKGVAREDALEAARQIGEQPLPAPSATSDPQIQR
jgi:hypothetical protein